MKKRIEAALPDCHADLHRRVRVDTTLLPWEASPSGTVWRQPLYRVGGEHGPVTSLVRYAPGGAFRPHAHPEGEEILVLDGVFADEHGDYPAGTYLLNPDGSRHAPRSDGGCLLFVRLRQYPGAERPRIVLDTTAGPWAPGPTPGIAAPAPVRPSRPSRTGAAGTLGAGRGASAAHPDGEELFILAGTVRDEEGVAGPGGWLRYPPGDSGALRSATGCRLYVRVGGLRWQG